MLSCLKTNEQTKARILLLLNLIMRIFSSAGKTLLFEQTLSAEMCCVEMGTQRRQKKASFVLLLFFSD